MQRRLAMATRIENMTNRKVVVRLSSGETLHIPPRTTSDDLSDVEVQNDKIEKLVERRVIAVHKSGGRTASSRSSR
jgi:hypothetical protein